MSAALEIEEESGGRPAAEKKKEEPQRQCVVDGARRAAVEARRGAVRGERRAAHALTADRAEQPDRALAARPVAAGRLGREQTAHTRPAAPFSGSRPEGIRAAVRPTGRGGRTAR